LETENMSASTSDHNWKHKTVLT